TSTSNATITDTSNNYFTIAGAPPPTITVTSPNGSETWQAGTYQTITWTYTGNPGAYVKIDLLKAGVVNSVIISSRLIGSGGSGSYSWLIPSTQISGSDYQVRITSTSNTAITDTSNNYFTIAGAPPPTITVTSPNGGETWKASTYQTITWTYTGNPGAYVKIDLLKAGVVNSVIISSRLIGSGGSGSHSWLIPSTQTSGSDYQVRITSTSNATITDTSDNYFTIAGAPPPTITVTSPNGGETWQASTYQTITWTYTGNPGAYVKIDLLKAGVVNSVIISSRLIGSGGSGSHSWLIPSTQISGSDYQVRITSTSNATITDTSNNYFTIAGAPPPTITVTSPNGGETWQASTYQTITWSYTGNPGAYVKIELLKGGVVNRVIISITSIGSGGSGSYRWAILPSQTLGSDYRVRVTSISNAAITDTSDGTFTISW
ncbi:MAG: hypothetical protein FJ012_00005, partial [Chloroflexi bacterium]|nr:hypothetical protein [Chloroflexota bacterium]